MTVALTTRDLVMQAIRYTLVPVYLHSPPTGTRRFKPDPSATPDMTRQIAAFLLLNACAKEIYEPYSQKTYC